jgi:hypothetical protein
MHGPRKRAGAVACIEGVRTPSLVAQKVMDYTDHHLIVGKDAQQFARGMGFKIEEDLNTERSRNLWLEWKRRSDPLHYLDPVKREAAMREVDRQMMAEGLIDPIISTAPSTATGSTRKERSAASRPRAASRGRSPAASAIHRSSAPVFTWTAP